MCSLATAISEMLTCLWPRSGRLDTNEIPDIVMALLLIALEPSSSSEILLDVVKAVDALCHAIAPGDDISKSIVSCQCPTFYTSRH